MNIAARAVTGALALIAAAGCRGGPMKDGRDAATVLREVPARSLEKLSGKRIYFGHQSVGYDIVGGLKALVGERPDLRLRIVEGRALDAAGGGAFLHARNGKNHPVGVTTLRPARTIRSTSSVLGSIGL